jgi:hypothetical protein
VPACLRVVVAQPTAATLRRDKRGWLTLLPSPRHYWETDTEKHPLTYYATDITRFMARGVIYGLAGMTTSKPFVWCPALLQLMY